VSVVVPTLNRAQLLRATLDSILGQTYPHVECIVMDGGSTDGTQAMLQGYGERIRWLSQPADGGPFAAINRGWASAKGDVLAWLNADDTWTPRAAEAVVEYMQTHPEVDVAYGGCGGIGLDGATVWLEPAREWDFDRAVLEYYFTIHQPACFLRRGIVDKVGGLANDWCHDHDLWLRVALAGGRFGAIDSHVANCRVWSGDAHKDPELMVPAVLRVVDRTFANPLLPARFHGKHGRARSNAYARCLAYLWFSKPSHWLKALELVALALREDPSNATGVVRAMARIPLPLLRALVRTSVPGRLRPGTRRPPLPPSPTPSDGEGVAVGRGRGGV
jgi:glycosyltransferase involved in cell wall biosynthesis